MDSGKLLYQFPEGAVAHEPSLSPEVSQQLPDTADYDRLVIAFIYSEPVSSTDLSYKGTWQTLQLRVEYEPKPNQKFWKTGATTDTRNGLEFKHASCTMPVKANHPLEVVYAYKPSLDQGAKPHLEVWEFRL